MANTYDGPGCITLDTPCLSNDYVFVKLIKTFLKSRKRVPSRKEADDAQDTYLRVVLVA